MVDKFTLEKPQERRGGRTTQSWCTESSMSDTRSDVKAGRLTAPLRRIFAARVGAGAGWMTRFRTKMEQGFRANFSQVKVHTDSESDTLNRSLQSRAFTTGKDIFFRQGEYNPGQQAGQKLIAHELTHVVQQNGARAVQRQGLSAGAQNSKHGDDGSATKQTPELTWNSATRGAHADIPYRAEMEKSFGQNFAGVKSYLGQSAPMKQIKAYAATRGDQVVFRSVKPSKALVAHELTHVVQNRKAGNAEQVQAKLQVGRPDSAAEHEAELNSQKVGSGERLRVQAKPAGGIQMAGEVYGGLSVKNKREVDKISSKKYEDEAAKFEMNLGSALAKDGRAKQGAKLMLEKLRDMIDAYHASTGKDKLEQIQKTFGVPEDQISSTYGAVKTSADNLLKTIDRGNLREMTTMLYRAFTSGQFAIMLDQAYNDLQDLAAKAHWAGVGLDEGALGTAQTDINKDSESVPERRKRIHQYFKRKDEVQDEGNKIRYGSHGFDMSKRNKDLQATKFTVESVGSQQEPLSYQELKVAFPTEARQIKQKATNKGRDTSTWKTQDQEYKRTLLMQKVGKKKLDWQPGYLWNQADPVLKERVKDLKVSLLTGLSGTTDMYMHAAGYLSLSKPQKQLLRLASLGSMLPVRDHTFFEIMEVAKLYGLDDYVSGPAGYKKIAPLTEGAIKTMGGINAFPGDYLSDEYKDAVAARKYHNLTKQKELVGVGIPKASIITGLMGDPKTKDDKSRNYKAIVDKLAEYEHAAPDDRVDILAELKRRCKTYIDTSKSRLFQGKEKTRKKGVIDALLEKVEAVARPLAETKLSQGGASAVLLAGLDNDAILHFYELHKEFTAIAGGFQPYQDTEDQTLTKEEKEEAIKTNKGLYARLVNSLHLAKLRQALGNSSLADGIVPYMLGVFYDPLLTETEIKAKEAWSSLLTEAELNLGGRAIRSDFQRPDENIKHVGTKLVGEDNLKVLRSYFKLEPAEIQAILKYTGASFTQFNDSSNTESADNKALISGLHKLPSYRGGPVYRGDYGDPNYYTVGRTFSSSAFTSTSKKIDQSFIAGRPTAYVYVHHKNAKDIEPISLKTWETELLFPPSKFRVVGKIDKKKGKVARTEKYMSKGKEKTRSIRETGTLDSGQRTLTGAAGIPHREFTYKGQLLDIQLDDTRMGKDAWKQWYEERFSNKVWIFLEEV